MKSLVFVALLGVLGASATPTQSQQKCGIRTCFIELFNLNDISFSTLIKKFHTIAFCVRECSPPSLTEFFQSIMFAITKHIPGTCSGNDCIEKNRFIALGHCFDTESWPFIRCGMRLVDVMQLKYEKLPREEQRNKTCDVIIETIMCFEETLKKCGTKVHSLMQGVLLDAVEAGINIYCSRSYKEGGIEVTIPEEYRVTTEKPIDVTYKPRKPVAKGYKKRSPGGSSRLSLPPVWMLVLTASIIPAVGTFYR